LPIAQYLKTEFEYKRYWNPYGSNVFVWRNFLGIAIPYGNSTNIPFSRSYSAGGSNDIRAWQTYDLGPGGELNYLEYKVGTLKIVSSFEYRFKVLDNIYSALFVDAGNIWDLMTKNG
jgi:outer membrane protein assembly factor BamA